MATSSAERRKQESRSENVRKKRDDISVQPLMTPLTATKP
jgi:hypothetical protein